MTSFSSEEINFKSQPSKYMSFDFLNKAEVPKEGQEY